MILRKRALAFTAGVVLVGGGAAVALHARRATAEDGPKFTVEVAGVRNVGASFKDLTPLNSWPGISFALLVKAEGCQVTGLDSSSRVKEVGDDTGADLFVGGGEARQTSFAQSPQVSKDAQAMMLELDNPTCPTKGAKSVHIEGKLVINTANGTESKKTDVTYETGQKFEMAGISIELEKVGESGWDEMPFQIQLKSSKSFETIAEWKFLDASGAEVKCQISGGWSFGGGNETTHTLIINLGKKLPKGTVVCECRKDLKKQQVPFKLDIPLGL